MSPFETVPADALLTQGDVIDDCPIYVPDPADAPDDRRQPDRFALRVVVLSQACDLANAKVERVLVAIVHNALALVERGDVKPSTIRDQIRRGQVFGWYFLPAADDLNLPESLVDLRDLHTVPRPVLERLIAAGKRVARLVTPFREHLAQHFAVTYMRIALPEPYDTAP